MSVGTIDLHGDDVDLRGLLSELIDLCYAERFEPAQAGDPFPSCAVFSDWLEEHSWLNLAEVFRSPGCDHEGWMLDILNAGLEEAELWAGDWLGVSNDSCW